MQTEQWSLQDAKKIQRGDGCSTTPTFIDHLLSMPTDDGEFARMDVHLTRHFEPTQVC